MSRHNLISDLGTIAQNYKTTTNCARYLNYETEIQPDKFMFIYYQNIIHNTTKLVTMVEW